MTEFESNVRQYIKTYKLLHGSSEVYSLKSKSFIVDDLVESFDYNVDDCFAEINKIQIQESLDLFGDTQYGMMLGRFQPFHFGHQNIVNEIILSGKKPIILIGSINEDRNVNTNPLTFEERKSLIEIIYPNNEVEILGIKDMNSWDDWMNNVIKTIKNARIKIKNVTLFFHNKEIDRLDFEYNNVLYTKEFYTKMFEIQDIKMQPIAFVDRKDFNIDANGRDIRHNLDGFKHFIDGRVYWELKKKGW